MTIEKRGPGRPKRLGPVNGKPKTAKNPRGAGLAAEFTLEMQKMFLEAYREKMLFTRAAETIGFTCRAIYRRLEKDADFKAAYEEAKRYVVETLEREADRRGVDGVLEPVYYKGRVVGQVRKFSDTLLTFRLRALDPQHYRDRAEISGPDGGPVLIKEVEVRLTQQR